MDAIPLEKAIDDGPTAPAANRRRWKRAFRSATVVVFIAIAIASYAVKDHVRTLRSLHRVPGTNAYVMDYYVDYNIDKIRSTGMDVANIEDSLIGTFFPDLIALFARGLKSAYLDEEITTVPTDVDRCSTIVVRTPTGKVLFGRNFDWMNDACLILKIHNGGSVSSVAVVDIEYLNLNRDDLTSTSLVERIPLLFAPYYLQDGMNRFGVAVADMSVDGVEPPYDPAKPNVIHSTAMRLVLDYAKTTDDAIDILKEYNIHFVETTCHLMIADAAGQSAVVEFVGGDMKVTRAAESWQVCTNHQISGKSETANDESCVRYRDASDQLAKLSGEADTDEVEVMQIMASVSKDKWTMWTSVYDLSDRSFRFAYQRHFDKPYLSDLESSD